MLGRVAVKAANLLRGKEKAIFTPHVDTGDFVVVINADKVRLTGKKEEQKSFMSFSGFVGGHKTENARARRARHPELLVEHAVRGMIPHNRLGRAVYRKLKVYRGELHPHAAQQPQPFRRSKPNPTFMAQTQEFIATGRRKTAVARIRMTPGSGKIDINGKSFEDYFPTVPLQNTVLQPLQAVKLTSAYDLSVNTTGGGPTGQAGAARLAISRALLQVDANLRGTLKAEGLLRRDPRMKERKKSGQPGARKRFQFSKR